MQFVSPLDFVLLNTLNRMWLRLRATKCNMTQLTAISLPVLQYSNLYQTRFCLLSLSATSVLTILPVGPRSCYLHSSQIQPDSDSKNTKRISTPPLSGDAQSRRKHANKIPGVSTHCIGFSRCNYFPPWFCYYCHTGILPHEVNSSNAGRLRRCDCIWQETQPPCWTAVLEDKQINLKVDNGWL